MPQPREMNDPLQTSHPNITGQPYTEGDKGESAGVSRHLFMPKDRMNTNTSHLTVINDHGELFCPKHGDFAIVRNGMLPSEKDFSELDRALSSGRRGLI
jgi:hypothetical protein